jgi:transposase
MPLLIPMGLKDTKHEMRTLETKNKNTKKLHANYTTQGLSSNNRRIRKKRSQYLRTPSYCTMSNLYYQSFDKQNYDRRNPNRKLYIVKKYCRKYPDDPGDHPINDDNVV